MLKARYAILTVAIFGFFVSCKRPGANGYKNAVEYNDHIIDQQSIVMKNIGNFVRTSNRNLDSADHLLDRYIIDLGAMVNDIQSMPLYKGDSLLRNSAADLFTFYRKLFREDYRLLLQYWREHGRQSPEGLAEANRVVEKITIEEEKYDKGFHNAQRDFAEKFNIKLREENR